MTNKLLSYFHKYKYTIIYLIIFAFLSFIFVPKEKEYYLEKDIKLFKNGFYLTFSISSSLILISIFLIRQITLKKKFNQLLNVTAYFGLLCFIAFFLNGNIISGFLLFINRQFNEREIVKKYEILNINENKYFVAENTQVQNDFIDQNDYYKYSGEKNASKLKNVENIELKFHEGLFGVNYIEKK